jgi:hypothetical protein
VVEAYGGRVAFLPLVPDVSTTDIARRLRAAEERLPGQDQIL